MSKNKVKLVTNILSISIIALMFVVGSGVIKKINTDTNLTKIEASCGCDSCKVHTVPVKPCKCVDCKCTNCKCMYSPKELK